MTQTRGSKTFQYPEEEKLTSISLVAASEKEGAQTQLHSHDAFMCCGNDAGGYKTTIQFILRELKNILLTECAGKRDPRG